MPKVILLFSMFLLFLFASAGSIHAIYQTFHEPNPVFVNSGKVFVYVISDQTLSDVTYSFHAWKDGEKPTDCSISATTANSGSGRLEKGRRTDGTLYQFTASWNINGCTAREGVWHFRLWVGSGTSDLTDASTIIKDYPFEMQQLGGEVPVIAPGKPVYSLTEDPYVILSNARSGNTYTFFWEASPTQKDIAGKVKPGTSIPQSVKLSRAGIQDGPGKRTLCMAIGDYVTALFLKCDRYKAVFEFKAEIPPPSGPECKINPMGGDHPNDTDDISLSASGVTPFTLYRADLNGDSKGTQYTEKDTVGPILLGRKLSQGTYTANLYKDADGSLVCGKTFTVGAKSPPGTYTSPATGPTTTSKGTPCNPPGGGEGILTAIGCVPTEPVAFVKAFLQFTVAIAGGFAFLLMIIGAFQMITSAGNPDTLNAGRDRFTNAIIGLLFVIFAVLLLKIIGIDILNFGAFFK